MCCQFIVKKTKNLTHDEQEQDKTISLHFDDLLIKAKMPVYLLNHVSQIATKRWLQTTQTIEDHFMNTRHSYYIYSNHPTHIASNYLLGQLQTFRPTSSQSNHWGCVRCRHSTTDKLGTDEEGSLKRCEPDDVYYSIDSGLEAYEWSGH